MSLQTGFLNDLEGFLSAVSIGFIPKDIEPIFSNDGMLVGLDILRSELLELSAVNVPAHADALAAGLDKKFEQRLTDYGTKAGAIQLEDYRKTLEGTFTEEEPDMKKLEELEGRIEALAKGMQEQADQIASLITLRETVDLSQKVMDTLNKSIVSLMSEKEVSKTPVPEGDGSTPGSSLPEASALMKTLDEMLSQFKEKAFKTTQVAKGENK